MIIQGGASVLNALLTSVAPNGEKLTNEEAEARSALAQAIALTIGAAAGVEGSELAGAVASAQAETDNNFLGLRQILAAEKEFAECQGDIGCQLQVLAKYSVIGVTQDGAFAIGIPIGAGKQALADLKGLYDLIKDPVRAYDAVKKLATDPAVRAQLGAAVLKDIDDKLAVVNRALEYGGYGNAQAAGEVIGSVAVTVIGAVDVAYGAAKAATTLATIGVKITKGVVKGAETAKGVAKTAPHVAPEAKPTPPTVNSTTASVKGDTPDVTPDGPIQVGEVTNYRDFQKRSVKGDGIEGDHSPSAAALIAAEERAKGRKLTAAEKRKIEQDGTVVAVPKEVHRGSRTYRGKNTRSQIEQDSIDLVAAACKDAACRADSFRKAGYSEDAIRKLNNEIIDAAHKADPPKPVKPAVPPKPTEPTPPPKPTKPKDE